jgi:hypothetical protein
LRAEPASANKPRKDFRKIGVAIRLATAGESFRYEDKFAAAQSVAGGKTRAGDLESSLEQKDRGWRPPAIADIAEP